MQFSITRENSTGWSGIDTSEDYHHVRISLFYVWSEAFLDKFVTNVYYSYAVTEKELESIAIIRSGSGTAEWHFAHFQPPAQYTKYDSYFPCYWVTSKVSKVSVISLLLPSIPLYRDYL